MIPGRGNVYLIGFSGTGKTISGANAAQELRMPFVDMDELIEYRTGKTIPEIFADDGEDAFRKLETDLLLELSEKPSRVVSTGGGVPTLERNREIMSTSGRMILLTAAVETISERLKATASRGRNLRPLLGEEVDSARIQELLDERGVAYGSAHGSVSTDGKSHAEVGREIAILWRKLRAEQSESTQQ